MWPHGALSQCLNQPCAATGVGQQARETFWPDSTHPLHSLWSWRAKSSVNPPPASQPWRYHGFIPVASSDPRISSLWTLMTTPRTSAPALQLAKFFSRRTGGEVWMASIQFLNWKLYAHFLFGDISCVWTQFVLLPALKLSRIDTSKAKLECVFSLKSQIG